MESKVMKKAVLFLTMMLAFTAALPVQAADTSEHGKQQIQQIVTNAIVIEKFYPPEGITTFKGRARVGGKINTEGKIVNPRIIVTSGSQRVDEIAMGYAGKWTFIPAMDVNGNLIECYIMISIPFNQDND